MAIENQKEYFNSTYENWKEIPDKKRSIINKTLDMLGISEGESVLDVASGVGVLYETIKHIPLCNYIALDISESMLKEVKNNYPEVKIICKDFDKAIELDEEFDFIIIFNSIPHFENLNIVFSNAKKHLKIGGVFAIVHSRTRIELKMHHKSMGYTMARDAIPNNKVLCELVKKYDFSDSIIKDDDFFYFSCKA